MKCWDDRKCLISSVCVIHLSVSLVLGRVLFKRWGKNYHPWKQIYHLNQTSSFSGKGKTQSELHNLGSKYKWSRFAPCSEVNVVQVEEMRSPIRPGLTTWVCISLMNAVGSGLDKSAHRQHHHCQCVTPNITPLTGFWGCATIYIIKLKYSGHLNGTRCQTSVIFFLCKRETLVKATVIKEETYWLIRLWEFILRVFFQALDCIKGI